MPEYTDILGNAQEVMGVFMAEDRTYLDMSGKLREAEGVFITDTLLYDDLSGNAREAQGVFIVGGGTPEPFWQPFTITAAQLGGDAVGYEPGVAGSITNEPVDGFTVVRVANQSGFFSLELSGPSPIASDALVNAVVGINAEDYSPSSVSSYANSGGEWVTAIEIEDVTEWTVDQQIPIVIIPQNG